MNLQKLYTMQAELDRHIEEKHGLEKEDLFDRKLLALLVELGELANETRCFKFWSTKPASEKKVILLEFVDGIHFILSLGIERGFHYEKELSIEKPNRSISEQFLEVYGAVNQFRLSRTGPDYHRVFREYLILGNMLGFTTMDIEQVYLEKNEVNYQRQQDGY